MPVFLFSLFQIVTIERWSMGIVRPVLDVYPYAWTVFVPFVIVTSFAVLNRFIAPPSREVQLLRDALNEE